MSEFGRILHDGRPRWVVLKQGVAVLLDAPPWERSEPAASAAEVEASVARWLSPVVPSKIIGVGRNHAPHAREHGAEVPREPLLFLKAPSSVLAPGADVLLPPESTRVECEGEMAVVIGRRVRRFPPDGDVAAVVLGYTVADDVTARDLQRSDGQWARGKSFDTFCPIAPVVTSQAPPPDAILETRVGGTTCQRAPLSEMIFSVAAILAHASAAMTLEPGDLVLTGTPAGVTALSAGDVVTVTVETLATLTHGVRAEAEPT